MKYWAYMNGEVPGSFTPEELAELSGFSMTTMVCAAQGEIAEKNWRRAGEFSDIAKAVTAHEERKPPLSPAPPPATVAATPADVDTMIDTASTKLFSHVADLMKELENRRDEKALLVSLQRQIAALKEELAQTRERSNILEMRLPRIAELEEAQKADRAALETIKTNLTSKEQSLNETRFALEKHKTELDTAKRRLQETTNDLALRNRLIDRMSKDLGEKELSLAKSLGVIRRLEEDLNRMFPSNAPAAPAKNPAPAPEPVEKMPREPEPELASEKPKAQQALVGFLKRVLPPNQPH